MSPGDAIQFVTLTADKLEFATNLFREAGYKTKVSTHALESDGYLAGTDLQRADDLQAAFDDPETAAVFCNRGGYGCARLLPLLDLDRIAEFGQDVPRL